MCNFNAAVLKSPWSIIKFATDFGGSIGEGYVQGGAIFEENKPNLRVERA